LDLFFNKYLKSELSGNLIDLCPVGALTSKPYAFLSRNWELKKIETIDYLDAAGSNIIIHTRNNTTSKKNQTNKFLINDQILRVLPKLQYQLNEHWLSDKTRYALDGLFLNRTSQILMPTKQFTAGICVKRYTNAEWSQEFLNKFLFNLIHQIKHVNPSKQTFGGAIGKILSIEEIYFFFKFLKIFGYRNILIENSLYNFNIDLPIYYQFNSFFQEIEKSDFLIYYTPTPVLKALF